VPFILDAEYKKKNTVPNPSYFLKYWLQLCPLELRNICVMKMQKSLKWQITTQSTLVSFSLLFFFFLFSFPFWHHIRKHAVE